METIEPSLAPNKLLPLVSFLKDKKKLLTALLVLLLVLTALIFLRYLLGLFQEFSSPIAPSPTPTKEATESGKRVPSSLAIDPEFVKLEGDVSGLEQDLNSVDLSESKLSPPIIELNVNFEN